VTHWFSQNTRRAATPMRDRERYVTEFTKKWLRRERRRWG
jgi:hypothetical protein